MVIRKSGSSKKKGFRRRWKNKNEKVQGDMPGKTGNKTTEVISENSVNEDDDSFSSQEFQDVGQFRWSINADERIGDASPPTHKQIIKSNRFTICAEDELYLSDECDVDEENLDGVETYIEDKDCENDTFEEKNQAEIVPKDRQDSPSSKRKKSKKKSSKSIANEKLTLSKSRSSRKVKSSKSLLSDESSSKSTSSKKQSSSKTLSSKRASKKDKKKKKKKSVEVPTEASSSSNETKKKSDRSLGDMESKNSTKPSRKVSFVDAGPDSRSESLCFSPVHKPQSPTRIPGSPITDPHLRSESFYFSPIGKLRSPTTTTGTPDRYSILQNKIRESLTSLSERSTMSQLILESANARSSGLVTSHRFSGTSIDPAFLEAFHSGEDRESVLERLSTENKDMLETLLDELHRCEEELQEERNELSKQRCMMQLKQEAVEHMLESEMDNTSNLESQILDLQGDLEHAKKATDDNELLLKIRMLEAENELLQQKTERQEETMATMSVDLNRQESGATLRTVDESFEHISSPLMTSEFLSRQSLALWDDDDGFSSMFMDQGAKAQGELLQLRSSLSRQREANTEQAREITRLKQELNAFNEKDRIKELEQTVANAEQQKKYFMKETERLKKLLTSKSPSKRSKRSQKSKGWFGISDNVSQKSLMDMHDANMVFGSVSDIDEVVMENEESSSRWLAA